uniref:Uncharacterized protein n=1 Tax=Tanacetum cinerariifolium TaxID=118510 RepID=A0A6L2P7Q7_TANCI|nr:hypothetical protein [Tanacetum cinerariifolium]
MLKVAKISEERYKSLIISSWEVNTVDSAGKSLSGTTVQPVTHESSLTPQVIDTQPAEETVDTADATQSIDAFVLVEDQGNQPQIADATRLTTDTKLRKKRISASFKPKTLKVVRESSLTPQVTVTQTAEETMATDDATQSIDASVLVEDQRNNLRSLMPQRAANGNPSSSYKLTMKRVPKVHEPIVEKAEHVAKEEDHDMGTDSGIVSMGDVRLEDMYVDDEESPFDTKSKIKVVKRMQPPNTDDEDQITFLGPIDMDTDPSIVQEDADLEKVDSDLASMPKDDIESVANFDTDDNIDIGKRKEMKEVRDKLKYCTMRIDQNCSRTKELVDMIRDMVHFLNSASVFRKANTEGEKWEKANPNPDTIDPTQREQQLKDDEMENHRLKALPNEELEAHAAQLAAYEAKRAKILKEYNHCITHRADPLPISKSSYIINNTSKEATMRITRNNDPLNLITQAGKLGIPPPLELTISMLFVAEKNRKRSSKIIKEVFVKEDIVVDGMHRNLVPPPGVEGFRGLVISEPELGIFFYNGNFNLVFQREEEFKLATTA